MSLNCPECGESIEQSVAAYHESWEAMREALRGLLEDADQIGGSRRIITRYETDRARAALALADKVSPK